MDGPVPPGLRCVPPPINPLRERGAVYFGQTAPNHDEPGIGTPGDHLRLSVSAAQPDLFPGICYHPHGHLYLQQLYQQAEALQISRADYAKVLEQQRNIELLNKALNAGQLSVIDYFTELTTIYDSHQSYLDVEKEYHSILAQLYQYKL